VRLRHPVEVINFAAEEATLPGGVFGSRAMIGALTPEKLDLPAQDGRSAAETLRAAGLDPAAIFSAARPAGSLSAYLELHIEQGSTLHREGVPIGLVTGIVDIRSFRVTFYGVANHAGTTPMHDRRDALVLAAPFITAVREIALEHGIVGTIGTLRLSPGASNVIPGQVELSLEIRGLDSAVLDAASAALAARAEGATFTPLSRQDGKASQPTLSDSRLLDALREAAEDLGLAWKYLPSGAGHDAMCIAAIAPMAMLFVPSVGGISHSPDEYTAPQDCANGARVLLGALLKLDQSLD
jgi:N-carbamoyl-L-amino-acid hydrolase